MRAILLLLLLISAAKIKIQLNAEPLIFAARIYRYYYHGTGEITMNKQKLCALFAAVILAAGITSGCSDGANNKAASKSSAGKGQTKIEKSIVSEITEGSLEALKATKISHVKIESENVEITASGIIYQGLDGKYGVISPDGSKNTGTVYASVSKDTATDKGYFVVRNTAVSDGSMNTAGLIDRNGEEIIKPGYAAIEIIGDRYAAVYTADEKTADKSKAVVGVNSGSAGSGKIVTPHPGDKDELYSGKIEIFDLKDKKSISLSVPPNPQEEISGKGTFIIYKDMNGKSITADSSGAEVTDGRTVLSNGDYVLKNTVYNGDGKELFGFDEEEFTVKDHIDPFYIGSKSENNVTEYFLIDKSGKKVSSALEEAPAVIFPDFLLIGTSVCKTDGTVIFGGFSSLKWDSVSKDAYIISNTNEDVIIFDKNGGIIYNGNYRDDKINSVDFNLYKNDDYYNCKTRSFSIKAEGTAGNWLVNQESDSVQNLIETRTGSTLIENYGKYTSVEDCVDHTGYIYAFSCIDGQTLKGDFDVYACSVDRNSTALPVLSGKAVFKENHHLV